MIQYEVLKDLVDIKTSADKTLLHDLVEMFIQQTPSRLNQIESGIKEKNNDQVMRTAHILKASCAYLGISEMAQLCSRLEEMAIRKEALNDQNALVCLYALEESYDESIVELTRYMSVALH